MSERKHMPWPVWTMIIIVSVFIGMVAYTVAEADETVTTKGTTPAGYVRLKSTTFEGVTTTKGTIDGKYVSTTTRNGVTTGTVDGERIRLKSKEVSKDFKPDWDPDW